MHSVCRCSLPVWRRSFLKKGTPRDLFWPRPGSAPGGIWPKNNNTCKGPWVLHPYQVSSKSIQRFWRRSRKCEKFTDGRSDGRRTDDGRTDDGRCAMTIAHSSLRLRWAKKCWFSYSNRSYKWKIEVEKNQKQKQQKPQTNGFSTRVRYKQNISEMDETSRKSKNRQLNGKSVQKWLLLLYVLWNIWTISQSATLHVK